MIYKLTYFPEKRWEAVDGQGKLAISSDLHFPKVNPPTSEFCLKQIVISNYRGSTKALSWWEQDNFWHQYILLYHSLKIQHTTYSFHFVLSFSNLFKSHGDIALYAASIAIVYWTREGRKICIACFIKFHDLCCCPMWTFPNLKSIIRVL